MLRRHEALTCTDALHYVKRYYIEKAIKLELVRLSESSHLHQVPHQKF